MDNRGEEEISWGAAGRPMQRVNIHRSSTADYADAVDRDVQGYAPDARDVAEVVERRIRYLFGVHGIHVVQASDPMLYADIYASVLEAFREGHWSAHLARNRAASDESARRAFRMMTRVLSTAVRTNDPLLVAVHTLGGFADVEPEAFAALERRRAEERDLVFELREAAAELAVHYENNLGEAPTRWGSIIARADKFLTETTPAKSAQEAE